MRQQEYDDNGDDDDDDNSNYGHGGDGARKKSRNVHRLRSAPMQGGRATAAAQGFTAEGGDLCGYEGGRRGPSHPEKADPGLASGDIELSTP